MNLYVDSIYDVDSIYVNLPLQLAYRVLAQNIFYKYSGRHAKLPTTDMLLYHSVGPHKRQSMEYHKVWMYNSSCSIFDDKINRESLVKVAGTPDDWPS